MSNSKERQVALVTGSTSGIGAATAKRFGEAGYFVVVTGRNERLGQRVCREIVDANGEAGFYKADLTKRQDTEWLVAWAADLGRLAVLVNCVGGNKPGMSEFDHIALNYDAPVAVTNAAVQRMDAGASVVNVSSIMGEVPAAHDGGSYAKAKAALGYYSRDLAHRLRDQQIRVNVVAPGLTSTADTAHLQGQRRHNLIDQIPLANRDFIPPKEIAEAVFFMATQPHITGQTLVVDGGMTI